jgi:DNA repair exonuclease SbcCD ATPase subunit
MRLTSVTIAGFRGFADSQTFDLSADVILVHGPNGSGKTSLFDAILWAITGTLERLKATPQAVVSKYAEFGEARVELGLLDNSNTSVVVRRRLVLGEDASTLALETEDGSLTGPAAEVTLMRYLYPDGATSSDPFKSLDRSLTRAVYLQQDDVTSFINDDDERERFAIVGEIVGAGRIGELIGALERERNAWTRKTNRDRDDLLGPLIARREALIAQISAASGRSEGAAEVREQWQGWLARAAALTSGPLGSDPARSPGQITADVLERIGEAVRRHELRRGRLTELRNSLDAIPPEVPGRAAAEQRLATTEEQLTARAADLDAARTAEAEARGQMVRAAAVADELAALARLALRHIDGDCPVCGQQHDVAATEARLSELVAQAQLPVVEPDFGLRQATEALAVAERERRDAQAELHDIDRGERARSAALRAVAAESAALDLVTGDDPAATMTAIDAQLAELDDLISDLQQLRRTGEQLAAGFAGLAEAERAAEIAAELPDLDGEIATVTEQLDRRAVVGEDTRRLHESLRELSESLVLNELESIEPMLRNIYASVDPHPSFKIPRLLAEMKGGRGRMWTVLEDKVANIEGSVPGHVLSSSQLNVLAVVTFMAMNLSAGTLPLNLAALDDPLQSLDNVNLLGLADLLRRTRAQRQLMVSTHDDRLAGLLQRKLRPVSEGQRTTVITFDGWDRHGPRVQARDVEPDVAPLRLVSHAG